jgi:hypothetical protein
MAVSDAVMHPAVYSTPVVLVGGVDWGIAIWRSPQVDRPLFCYAALCVDERG